MAAKYDNLLKSLSEDIKWSPRNEETLLESYTYVRRNPGKEIRAAMIASLNAWLGVEPEKLKIITDVVSMLHTASLMVDDIEDNSQLRRGEPVAYKIYGIPQVLNTANYVYFLAFQELTKLAPNADGESSTMHANFYRIVTAELLSLHRGQGLELYWRDSLTCPTEEEYVDMVNCKTGGLFRILVKLMMACATKNVGIDYVPLVNLTGVYFQIRDDYMNLQSSQYTVNKGFAEDITEGKFSFPIIHGVRANPTDRQIMNVLQKRPTTPSLKIHAINYLESETKSFAYTRDVLTRLERQTREELARLGGNPGFEKILDALALPQTD